MVRVSIVIVEYPPYQLQTLVDQLTKDLATKNQEGIRSTLGSIKDRATEVANAKLFLALGLIPLCLSAIQQHDMTIEPSGGALAWSTILVVVQHVEASEECLSNSLLLRKLVSYRRQKNEEVQLLMLDILLKFAEVLSLRQRMVETLGVVTLLLGVTEVQSFAVRSRAAKALSTLVESA